MEDIDLFNDILSFGVKTKERVLHFGCGDKQINFIDNIHKKDLSIYYLGIDADIDLIDNFEKKYSNEKNYVFENTTIQNFLDYNMSNYDGNFGFENIVITGIFDKPMYKEKQYIFISTVVKRCSLFSNKIIFTVDSGNYKNYEYNILYSINNLITSFENIEMKKRLNKYIFCVTF
jgi:hypothetical protein